MGIKITDGKIRLIGSSQLDGEFISRYAKRTYEEWEEHILRFVHEGLTRAKSKRKGGDGSKQ